jgi:ribosomal protein S10
MNVLSRSYLSILLTYQVFKLSYFTIVYKILMMFIYNYLSYLKMLKVKSYKYRLYILNTNFYFLFIDYIYILNYATNLNNQLCAPVGLPIKKRSYAILRSPFIYSKSKENFSIQLHAFFLDLTYRNLSEMSFFFYSKLLYKIKLDNSKIFHKRKVFF